ncbi:MAG: DUF4150 domain-containing protein [Comamonadaceae bacterium]|nr:MAG: DUF4150 domain-containing protein [Comamonadaceae bacterium]
MSNQVYANNMEVSCKAADGKSICAFPDVCFTPPTTPATPPGVPIPYPNTGMASDTTSGSTSVQISGKEVMLKNKSYFRRSTGDEAGCASKKGVVTSQNMGKVYFTAWSMDVKVEGENVVRMLDLTTHNHASQGPNTPPWPYTDEVAAPAMVQDKCQADKGKVEKDCKDGADPCPGSLKQTVTQQRAGKTRTATQSRTVQAGNDATADAESSNCVKAMRCGLRPYKPDAEKGGCCPGQTPHHIPPKSMMKGIGGYSKDAALCVCLEGASQHVGSHGENHAAIDHAAATSGLLDSSGQCTVASYNKVCADAVAAQCGCSADCIEAQLNSSFTDAQKESTVKHWQSNSKQLSDTTKSKINDAYAAASKASKDK